MTKMMCRLDFSRFFLPKGVFERLVCLCIHLDCENPKYWISINHAKFMLNGNLFSLERVHENIIDIKLESSTVTAPKFALQMIKLLEHIEKVAMGKELIVDFLVATRGGHFVSYRGILDAAARGDESVSSAYRRERKRIDLSELQEWIESSCRDDLLRRVVKAETSIAIVFSFRGTSGRDKANPLSVQSLCEEINVQLKGTRYGAFESSNDASEKTEIIEAVLGAKVLVVVLTEDYFDSPWCVAEFLCAVKYEKKVIITYWVDNESSKDIHLSLLRESIEERIQRLKFQSMKDKLAFMNVMKQVGCHSEEMESLLNKAAKALNNPIHVAAKLMPITQREAAAKEILSKAKLV